MQQAVPSQARGAGATLAAPLRCLNCGRAFGDERFRFCPDCGQQTNVRPPTLAEFAQQFGGAYFSTEGALWRTLALLVLRPGELTRRYLAGQRKHYVLPLRLYLTISLVTLLLIRSTSSIATAEIDASPGRDRVFDGSTNVELNFGFVHAGVRQGTFFCEGLPAAVCDRIRSRIDVDAKGLANELQRVKERLASQAGNVMFLLMPLFAFGLRLLYANRGLRYTEHLVFALHLHAFWFFALALMQIPWAPVELAGNVAIPAYALLAMHRVYGGRWWPLVARAAVLSALYGLAIAIVVGLGALAALLL